MACYREASVGTLHRYIKQEQTEVCESILKANPSLANVKNGNGETALHIACKHYKVNPVTGCILKKISDVNARNYWGQTALHYAAEARSVETIKLLLGVPGIHANYKDVNGYTVLHTFVISSKKFDDNWTEGIKLLINTNIDVNAQTHYGQTILHLVSYEDDNADFLHHLLTKYKDLDLKARNISGENFLHIYGMTEIGEMYMSMFETIGKINKPVLTELLNQKDVSGSTPWCLMFETGELTSAHFKYMTNVYDVIIDATDCLGNTALIRRVGKDGSGREDNLEIYRQMIKNGLDVNFQNVFGRSAASLLYLEDVYRVLSENRIDFARKDRWGRLPIVNLLNQNTNPKLLETILKSQSFMVNSKDFTDSTSLHFAAYLGKEDYVELLLKHGTDLEARDVLGHTALDIARHHGHSKCWKLLVKAAHFTSAEEEEFLYKAPNVTLDLSCLIETPISELLEGFPEHMDTFAELVLDRKYKIHPEVSDIVAAVNKQVKGICEIVKGYDSRFRMSVFQTGSTAEGTKVGAPDEFDFALCIESLNDICDIETSLDAQSFGYARLKFKDDPVPDEYISFSDTGRYFLALPFLHLLFRYIRRALNESKLWEDSNLYTRSDEKIHVIREKPVLNYHIYWNGVFYKHLSISVDLVPAVYKRGWWPNYATFVNKKLINDEVKEAGCFILMQTEENSFDDEWHKMSDSITFTCKSSTEADNGRLLQISIAPAEIALMKSLPEIYRRGYALAKIIRSSDVCPKVKIDIEPPAIDESLYREFKGRSVAFVDPSHDIKSYWLKNCVFYIVDENDLHTSPYKSPLQITLAVYQKLQSFAASWNFRPYIIEKSDLFDFVEGTYVLGVFIARRKVNIDTVLAVLGQPFPKDIRKWITSCKTNYMSKFSRNDDTLALWTLSKAV